MFRGNRRAIALSSHFRHAATSVTTHTATWMRRSEHGTYDFIRARTRFIVDFQINGTTYPLNINAQPEIWPNTNAPSKFEASAQLDGDYFGHGYSLSIDKWIISYTY